MQASALPGYLRIWWFCASPLAFALGARIVWEKIEFIHTSDPQLASFSLIHLYPTFGIIGILCSFSLLVWLLQAASYLITRWREISLADAVMTILAVLLAILVVMPERLLA